MRVLIAGATGFVGSRLIDRLLADGHDVVAFSRSASEADFPDGVETIDGNLLSPESLTGLCEDIDVAYYLIHSLSADNFAALDNTCANEFQRLASEAGVDRVIYLSGISSSEGDLSPHLESRREVETILSKGSFDLTVIRAAIIIGAGSASFRIVDDIVSRLPVMIVPEWVRTPCQPIAVDDVIEYAVRLLDVEETRGQTYDIGGPSELSYEELIRLTAKEKSKRVYLVPVPVMTPELSSHWLRLTTSVQYNIARPLVGSMRHPVVVDSSRNLQDVIEIDRTPISTAINRAISERD